MMNACSYKTTAICLSILLATGSGAWGAADMGGAYQLSFTAADATNPYTSKSMSVTFTGTSGDALGHSLTIGGYWDGGTSWGARFAPAQTGAWSYTTSSADSGLDAKTGTVTVTTPTVEPRLQVRPDAPKYLQRVNGDPYMLVGDTWWRCLWTAAPSEAVSSHFPTDLQYGTGMNVRQSQGFNFALMNVTKFDGSCELNGSQPFTSYSGGNPNPDTLNPAFFQQMDWRMQCAAYRGMVAGLTFSWADQGYWGKTSDAQSDRINQYLINRYGAYPVMWLGVAEYDEAGSQAEWAGMADYYRTHDPYHNPVSFHPERDGKLTNPASRLDVYSVQRYNTFFPAAVNAHSNPGIPYVNAEYGYESGNFPGHSITATEALKRSWQIVTGGGAGLVYGNFDWCDSNDAAAMESDGSHYMANLSKFWQNSGVEYWKFDTFTQLDTYRYEAKDAGGQRVVWVEEATGSFQINLSDLPGTHTAKWFNAATGVWGAPFTLTGGGMTTVTAPGQYYALSVVPGSGPPPPTATIIYQDTFSRGSPASPLYLNSSEPEVRSGTLGGSATATWRSHVPEEGLPWATLGADAQLGYTGDTPIAQSWLPFVPQDGCIYTYSVTMDNTWPGTNNWLVMGFMNNADDPGSSWFTYASGPGMGLRPLGTLPSEPSWSYTDAGNANSENMASGVTGEHEFEIVLDTTAEAWKATFAVDGGATYFREYTYTTNPTITHIAFGNGGGRGHVDNFTLTAVLEPEPSPIPGDANLDWVVNDKDASILGKNWLVQSGASWSMGDFNGDKKVNDADAAILAAHWGQRAVEGASVPEPSAVALLLGALVSLFVWRQRG